MSRALKDYKYVDCFFKVEGRVATFTMSNPAARNAGTMKMREGMFNAIQTVRENDDIRVLVLTGDPEGKTFGGGLNVKRLSERRIEGVKGAEITPREDYTPGTPMYRMATEDRAAFRGTDVPDGAKNLARAQYQYWREQAFRGGYFIDYEEAILRLPKPVIAMVNGAAAGMHADLALMCDIIIASDQSYLLWSYIHRGMVTAEGGTFLLPRLCGYNRALEILYLGDRVPAQQLYEWGIINHVIPHDQLKEYTYNLAGRLAAESPPMGMGMVKYAVQRGFGDFVHNLEMHRQEVIGPCNQIFGTSNDSIEGGKAFAEKRKPNYTGT